MLPSGFLTLSSAGPLLVGKAAAEVQSLPGRRIIWVLAPAPRMPVTTAWTVSAHLSMSGTSWGCLCVIIGTGQFGAKVGFTSFMIPNTIFVLLAYLEASCVHRLTNCSLVGPPCPMICPFQRASAVIIMY